MNFLSVEEELLYHKINEPLFEAKDGHRTASAFVVNPEGDKVLMIYHLKYDSWGWMGGHVQEGESFLQASMRELNEESGLSIRSPLSEMPILVGKMRAFDHYHYDCAFVFVASEDDALIENKKETKGIAWLEVSKLDEMVGEKHMLIIYHKILERIYKSGLLRTNR
ncbi:MAG: NUDIX domain-containing protein [Peptostreptococcaceae bacterium]|nr:NUDIX domain-containing protein [Peptostreptococcaceae bacterium]